MQRYRFFEPHIFRKTEADKRSSSFEGLSKRILLGIPVSLIDKHYRVLYDKVLVEESEMNFSALN